ncbi:MAG: SMP-30/gluconolactonase/LRE family protein [Ignavibacteria bacterium]|nr:SMP-30/gluconolactonase/LRE family protein [Ignavibacteria bacterium]
MKKILIVILLVTSIAFSQSPIPKNAKLEKISTGHVFVEGPVWKDGVGLLFSDMGLNSICKWNPESGTTVFMKPSFVSNGLTYDNDGKLVMMQTGLRRIARLEKDGTTQTSLTDKFEGKRFNSPNDIVVKSSGSIFFTDPDFNIPGGEKAELSIKGIYRLGINGSLKLLDDTFDKPNGICFSPDEKKLYVCESPKAIVYTWDVVDDSTVANKNLFYAIPEKGYADGMKTDHAGNLYCTGPGGVWVISPDGKLLDKIATPETPTNCNWGDADRKTLYITAQTSVYRIRLVE